MFFSLNPFFQGYFLKNPVCYPAVSRGNKYRKIYVRYLLNCHTFRNFI
ncbi:Uncharacterized protein dnm_065560 [Desulfonema magnum]|uniref:Uncharacterized protein n=1 Tax=Desulfonema magnum TaxID=45655 RepID=A0A975GR26_9BACT|nr:Uncharacterized protein dnm_065560 [Desulfonema magnum]